MGSQVLHESKDRVKKTGSDIMSITVFCCEEKKVPFEKNCLVH